MQCADDVVGVLIEQKIGKVVGSVFAVAPDHFRNQRIQRDIVEIGQLFKLFDPDLGLPAFPVLHGDHRNLHLFRKLLLCQICLCSCQFQFCTKGIHMSASKSIIIDFTPMCNKAKLYFT